jgi:hypothetical protein
MMDSSVRSAPLADTAALLFDRLGRLHHLAPHDCELLRRAAVGVTFIRTSGAYSTLEHELFGLALSDLGKADARMVEAVSCIAADRVALQVGSARDVSASQHRRELWLAAVLRLADAIVCGQRHRAGDVYAAWTDDVLYVEVDGPLGNDAGLDAGMSRVAALEAICGRRVLLSSSARRREAARTPAA